MQSRILIVSHDATLRNTRSAVLLKAGYAVSTAEDGKAALKLLETNAFDLVLVGRRSLGSAKSVDQILREKYPKLLILKIAELIEESSSYPSRTTDAVPGHVLAALKGMLG